MAQHLDRLGPRTLSMLFRSCDLSDDLGQIGAFRADVFVHPIRPDLSDPSSEPSLVCRFEGPARWLSHRLSGRSVMPCHAPDRCLPPDPAVARTCFNGSSVGEHRALACYAGLRISRY